MRYITFAIVVLLALWVRAATAAGPENCVQFPITGTSESAVADTGQFSAPWTVYNQALGCTGLGSANIKVYGPCLDNASPCHRGPGTPLVAPTPSLDATTVIRTGPGVLDGVSIVPVAVPTAKACIGGSNNAVACSADSACPSGRCGPCRGVVSFCGINPGVNGAREQ